MDNYKKFGVFAGQILMGFGFSLLGGFVGLIAYNIVADYSGTYVALTGNFMNMGTLIGCCIGLLTGISFDGYSFLKQNLRQHEFLKFLLVSVVGTFGGLYGLYLIFGNSYRLGLGLSIFFAIALFVTGTLLGSMLVLTRDPKQT
jgi:hypothetical protein